MSTPTNTEIFDAIARLLACRDSRRGRKPALIVTIITRDDGKVVVTDHNTDCTVEIGKRTYKKRTYTTPTKAAIPSVKRTVTVTVSDKGIRISPRTGKPVRPYNKVSVKPIFTKATYKDKLTQELAEYNAGIANAKLAREAAMNKEDNAKAVAAFDRVIKGLELKAAETKAILAVQP